MNKRIKGFKLYFGLMDKVVLTLMGTAEIFSQMLLLRTFCLLVIKLDNFPSYLNLFRLMIWFDITRGNETVRNLVSQRTVFWINNCNLLLNVF